MAAICQLERAFRVVSTYRRRKHPAGSSLPRIPLAYQSHQKRAVAGSRPVNIIDVHDAVMEEVPYTCGSHSNDQNQTSAAAADGPT